VAHFGQAAALGASESFRSGSCRAGKPAKQAADAQAGRWRAVGSGHPVGAADAPLGGLGEELLLADRGWLVAEVCEHRSVLSLSRSARLMSTSSVSRSRVPSSDLVIPGHRDHSFSEASGPPTFRRRPGELATL
jgi:hypothetical protein